MFCKYSQMFIQYKCIIGLNYLAIYFFNNKVNTISVGHSVAWWLRRYATSRKVAGLRTDEVITFFSIYLILPASLGAGIYSASNRNEYQKQKNDVSVE
jgi:hypothetical protein